MQVGEITMIGYNIKTYVIARGHYYVTLIYYNDYNIRTYVIARGHYYVTLIYYNDYN